jgi:hypothetical protein
MAIVACSITSGQSLSAAADLGALQLQAIVMPAAWDNADLSFQISVDAGTTFNNFFIAGASGGFGAWKRGFDELVIPVAASRIIGVFGFSFPKTIQIKCRSGKSSNPVNQTAGRSISLITI